MAAISRLPPKRDFVAENQAVVVKAEPSAKPPAAKAFSRDTGKVPKYLQRIKNALVDEENLVKQQLGLNFDPNGAPPGYRMLPDEERLGRLAQLQRSKTEIEARHRKLPLKIETAGHRKAAQDIERELQVVETDIETFSKPKIFVRD